MDENRFFPFSGITRVMKVKLKYAYYWRELINGRPVFYRCFYSDALDLKDVNFNNGAFFDRCENRFLTEKEVIQSGAEQREIAIDYFNSGGEFIDYKEYWHHKWILLPEDSFRRAVLLAL